MWYSPLILQLWPYCGANGVYMNNAGRTKAESYKLAGMLPNNTLYCQTVNVIKVLDKNQFVFQVKLTPVESLVEAIFFFKTRKQYFMLNMRNLIWSRTPGLPCRFTVYQQGEPPLFPTMSYNGHKRFLLLGFGLWSSSSDRDDSYFEQK